MLTERAIRSRLAKRGKRLHKIRENSRDYPEYGPYMVTDFSTDTVSANGMDLAELAGYAEANHG